ncbi:hypothetical protein PAXRUDRAFT_145543, partial [Paxillus rubicundulus Ve08.2h10]
DDVFVILLPLRMVWVSRQEVSLEVGAAWTMMQGEIVVGEFCNPTSLTTIKFLWLTEIVDVLMIGPDLKGVRSAHQKVTQFREGNHDGKKFIIMNFIIAFCGVKRFREECKRMPYIALVL